MVSYDIQVPQMAKPGVKHTSKGSILILHQKVNGLSIKVIDTHF
jgi:hypothetical protein